ncbi:hypothetical protein RJ640_002419 [Escallonia rubra]|uniref:RING-type domain-containing protein n=1 Tax=Escallonia rubra TaxID=112253 RepID=A0AA88RZ92_9ASTE|nr:hypothetical protein RJ640_002419 [Escallonia rubra]
MGGSGKGKNMKGKGKSTSRKSDNVSKHPESSKPNPCEGQRQVSDPVTSNKPKNENAYLNVARSDWNKYYEEKLVKLLYNKIEMLFDEALQRLLALGYDGKLARKALLENGHGGGEMSVLSNIVSNSIAYITRGNDGASAPERSKSAQESVLVFKHLSERINKTLELLEEFIRESRSGWTKSEALLYLLSTNLHDGFASDMFAPLLPGRTRNLSEESCGDRNDPSKENVVVPPHVNVELLNRINLKPTSVALLNHNVKTIAAAYRPYIISSPHSLVCSESSEEPDWEEDDLLQLVEWIESKSDDPKKEVILRLVEKIRDLMAQAEGRKEWAKQKMLQAAQKVGHDLLERRKLRMEKVEVKELMKNHILEFEDRSWKRFLMTANVLRQANSQLNYVTEAVRRLKNQNSDIRANVEAYKLSTSESNILLREVEKREKKSLKKVMALEKECRQLQEQIDEQREKNLQLNHELLRLNKAQEEAEETGNLGKGHVNYVHPFYQVVTASRDLDFRRRLTKSLNSVSFDDGGCALLKDAIACQTIFPVQFNFKGGTIRGRISTAKAKIDVCLEPSATLEAAAMTHFHMKPDTTVTLDGLRRRSLEVRWMKSMKEREVATALIREEEKLKKTAEVDLKRYQKSLHQEMKMDCQNLKDNMHRLQDEFSKLQRSHCSLDMYFQGTSMMLPQLGSSKDSSSKELLSYRECVSCLKNEASTLLLPCAHQVLCTNCTEDAAVGASCPCCQVLIEQLVRVYSGSS